jgi:DnaK suppressor protein
VDELAVERERTLERISSLEAAFDDVVASIEGVGNDDEHDPDGTTIAFERAQVMALLASARNHLEAVDAAIARRAAGEVAACASCGEPIPAERLAALPATTTCVGCAG